MSLRKKIVLISTLPVILLGMLSLVLTLTVVKSSMIDEVQYSLKGTAAATLAAYDQNAGEYIVTENGDVWKGGYNISKSEKLVDRIKEKSGMDVTFFYGDKRIMSSAVDKNGYRILGSPAGTKIVEKVLKGGEEYFSNAVSMDGMLMYGYYMPVYQNGTNESPIGMVFVGAEKAVQDAAINKIVGMSALAVIIVMVLCMIVAIQVATNLTRHLKTSIGVVRTVAKGELDVDIDKKLLKRHDEIGKLSKAMVTLRDELRNIMTEISRNASQLSEASDILDSAANSTNSSMHEVERAVAMITESSTEQAENSRNTSENMRIMGENITKTSEEVEILNQNAAVMQQSSEKAAATIDDLRQINQQVEEAIANVQSQTIRTNESVQKIHQATEFITSIAEETNLLSLNASIEAARAGDAGRGFAVVADQISKLAEQSNKSSKDIEEVTAVLIADSAKAVDIMQKMQEIITRQSKSMDDTQSIVGEVMEGIGASLNSISQIKGSTVSLEGYRNEVVQSVDELSDIAQENAASTHKTDEATRQVAGTLEQVSDSADELKRIADELVNSIQYFHL